MRKKWNQQYFSETKGINEKTVKSCVSTKCLNSEEIKRRINGSIGRRIIFGPCNNWMSTNSFVFGKVSCDTVLFFSQNLISTNKFIVFIVFQFHLNDIHNHMKLGSIQITIQFLSFRFVLMLHRSSYYIKNQIISCLNNEICWFNIWTNFLMICRMKILKTWLFISMWFQHHSTSKTTIIERKKNETSHKCSTTYINEDVLMCAVNIV